MADAAKHEARALILTRRSRDAEIAAALLAEAGIDSAQCDDIRGLIAHLDEGAALVIVTERALDSAGLKDLADWLDRQAPWSDLPFVLLTHRSPGPERNPSALRLMKVLGNVSFLERPFHPTTFVSLVQAALRARHRQYLARDHLHQRERAAATMRRTAERLEFAQTAGRLGAWELDVATKAVTASAICKAHFGRAPSEDFTYDDFRRSIHPDDRERVARAIEAAIKDKQDYDIEYRVVWPDGSMHWVNARGETTEVDEQPRFIGITLDVTERKEAEQRQWLLTAELDHRVKNLLAVIQALVAQTRQRATDIDDFANNLGGRLQAIARTNHLLSQSRWQGASLAGIIGDEMQAYTAQDGSRVTVKGDDLLLRPKAATALGMAIHELATNAAKYGALSHAQGNVAIEWRRQPGPKGMSLLLHWRERGNPMTASPERRGFGSMLIERVLAFEVDGRAELDFGAGGLVCTIEIPEAQLLDLPRRTVRPDAPAPRAAPRRSPGQRRPRVLVVEDSALVAMDVEAVVTGLGCEVVGPASRLKQARVLAEREPLDGAILDVDLDGNPVFPVAETLRRRDIPFFFATGYDPATVLPPRFQNVQAIQKPFNTEALVQALDAMIGSPGFSERTGGATRARREPEAS